jgi:hypothetical protein
MNGWEVELCTLIFFFQFSSFFSVLIKLKKKTVSLYEWMGGKTMYFNFFSVFFFLFSVNKI